MTQYDSHYGFDDDAARKFSWARVAGFSFAIALHVSAFMLMLTPTAPPQS
ncbi:MAG: energy transducer TonB, partial [Gammaproteobacteria bacterium]